MEVTGKIKLIGQTETIGEKGFKKRLVVVITPGDYPQEIGLEFTQDNVDKLDAVKVGEEVTVGYNLRGREYNGKYYVNLNGWKIDKGEAQQAAPAGADDDDSLPF